MNDMIDPQDDLRDLIMMDYREMNEQEPADINE